MADTMRGLSLRQASNCETAKEPVCRCRCGGALHGAARGTGTAFFAALPPDDPHHIPTAEMKKEAKRREREVAQQRKWELLGSVGAWRNAGVER